MEGFVSKLLHNKSNRYSPISTQRDVGVVNKVLTGLLSLLFVFSSFISSPAYINAESATNYPIMHLTAEERAEQNQVFLSAPIATIDKQIQTNLQLTQGKSFSLLPFLSYDPAERDQGHVGNCWVWGGTGVMEIALNVQLGIKDRLSIQYLDSIYNGGLGDDWAGMGGSATRFAAFYDAHKMIIPWANINAHYQDYDSPDAAAISIDKIAVNRGYLLESVTASLVKTHKVSQETAISNIKNILNQNKGIYFSFAMANSGDWGQFFNFWNIQSESDIWSYGFSDNKDWNDAEGGGHGVLCVGYDDSDPDPAKHCWIMLNSWGITDGRPNGLFRIAMDYDYDAADSDGYYNTGWWAIESVYLGALNQNTVESSVGADNSNSKHIIPVGWWGNPNDIN